MAVPRQLDEAVARMERAALDLEAARSRPASPEGMRLWLEALTEYTLALGDVHRFTNESVHEKLHAVASRLGVRDAAFPGSSLTEAPPD